MVDLQQYRIRIGTFCVRGPRARSRAFFTGSARPRGSTKFPTSVLVLALFAFILICIELNPGPPNGISFSSIGEKTLVDSLKQKHQVLAKLVSHRFFLVKCRDLKITPTGFDLKIPLSAAQSNRKLETEVAKILKSTSSEIVSAILKHYEVCIVETKHDVDQCFRKLAQSCSKERHMYLKDHITALFGSFLQTLQNGKLKKINGYLNKRTVDPVTKWIPELGLSTVERGFLTNGEQLCDQLVNAMTKLMMEHNPLVNVQSSCMPTEQLIYSPLETLHVHHNGRGHFVTSSSIGGQVKFYDSLNLRPSSQLLEQMTAIYSPDDNSPEVFQSKIVHQQTGGVDCGCFAIAYAVDLFLGYEPSTAFYDQGKMRDHMFKCLTEKKISRFPIHRTTHQSQPTFEVTRSIPKDKKWCRPKKPATQPCKVRITPLQLSNRFSPLSDTVYHQQVPSPSSNAESQSNQHAQNYAPSRTSPQNTQSDTPTRSPMQSPATIIQRGEGQERNRGSKSVINLTRDPHRPLSKEEIEVLELGLTFCPSQKLFNKETLAQSFQTFFRRLKLTEYFFQQKATDTTTDMDISVEDNSSTGDHNDSASPEEHRDSPNGSSGDRTDNNDHVPPEEHARDHINTALPYDQTDNNHSIAANDHTRNGNATPGDLAVTRESATAEVESFSPSNITIPYSKEKWEDCNSGWYPQAVRQNRSQGLMTFMNNVLSDVKNALTNQRKYFNNLDERKRAALANLQQDKSIIIKPSDKCGSVVVMSTKDYEAAGLSILSDTTYYEEVPTDPNGDYCRRVQEECSKLLNAGYISERQFHSLTANGEAPTAYFLPKMHKSFSVFPAFRPICSGTNSPTAKLSQFVDSFLRPLAEKCPSYVKDTTHFLQRLAGVQLQGNNCQPILATMDVTSLYPNIDHSEGVRACLSHLQQGTTNISPTILRRMINLILKSNTMSFKDRFFHQTKGTAMGTGMAVNYANLFMADLEDNMLD